VATEGVDYDAALATNFLPGGADPLGIADMVSLFNNAGSKCPNSVIVAAGYRQVDYDLDQSMRSLTT
jgi:cutinase